MNKNEKEWQESITVIVLVVVMVHCHEIAHHEFVPKDKTVNAAFYVDVLERLKDHVCRVRPCLSNKRRWILHDGTVPLHSAEIVRECLACRYTSLRYSTRLIYTLQDFFVSQMQRGAPTACIFGHVMRIRKAAT